MEEPVPADDQQRDAELAGSEDVSNKSASDSPEVDSDGFDADLFASLMQQELIAYSLSWEPLMKVLRALGVSMAKQQRTQQSNTAAMKKMEEQVAALRDDLGRSEDERKEAAAAMETMQNRMSEMQNKLEEFEGVAPVYQENQQQGGESGEEKTSSQEATPTDGNGGEGDTTSDVKQWPRSSRASSVGNQAFVTAKELADATQELKKELKRALAHALGKDNIDETGENEDEKADSPESSGAGNDDSTTGGLNDESPKSTRSREVDDLQLTGAPYASAADLKQEVEKLQGFQDALNARVAEHDQLLDALNSRMGKLDELSSQLSGPELSGPESGLLTTPRHGGSIDGSNGNDGNSGNGMESSYAKQDEFAAITNDILNELKGMKAVQDGHEKKLRDHEQTLQGHDKTLVEHGQKLGEHGKKLGEHDETVHKHTADIKALADSLDDLSVQQQTVASMYSGGSANAGSTAGSGDENAADGDSEKSGNAEKQGGKPNEVVSQPQLDLSLVFTKLADLRRSTDASLDNLQQSIKGVSGTTQSQQEQLDALRNNVVFNEHLQAHLVEARLAMQKELLARNQTFQDRTKPQLAEWRKGLELTEDKLLQGTSDDETMHTLQQMQRCYHRTLLSIAPLVNSPLSIAETLQSLSDEVKQLQNAVRLGVVPLRVVDYNNSGDGTDGEGSKEDREEEYIRKLRYLDEEIDATLQVNITTEKKNDPLIKGLDAMREKLELLWSMWHRNYNFAHSQPNQAVVANDNTSTNAAGGADNNGANGGRRSSYQQRNPDEMREMELRLSGAVRRLAMVEEDIERLNSLTSELSAADKIRGSVGSGASISRRGSSSNLRTELIMEEMEKLRKDVYAEVAKLATQEGSGGTSSNNNINNTSLVSMDRRSMVEAAAKQGDVLTDLYSQMTGRELDTRLNNSPEGQKQFYDHFIKEVTKKVSGLINAEKGGSRGPGIGGSANANVNYRMLLDNFAQKVEDRLEDAREFTTEELARLRRELMEQLKIRFEVALRDIRGELMLLQSVDGDSTAMGTKPVMCVACSRPVPVSRAIHEAGSLPVDNPEPINPGLPAEFDYDRPDDEFVFRAGFKMPANDRKILTLPFLTTAMRSKMVLNKPEGKRKRPPRQSHLSRVDNVVREAMELDRASRGRHPNE